VPNVVLNGEDRALPDGCTLRALLESLGLDARHVAVERNRQIVARASYGHTALSDGDRIEIVTIVGGG
jgi:thiamine biosynthesis protein ThiS